MTTWNIVNCGDNLPDKGRDLVVRPGKKHGDDWQASDGPGGPVIAQLELDEDNNLVWACTSGVWEDIISGDEWFYVPE